MPPPLRDGSVVRLLEIDPELGRGLAGERLEAARRDTIGRVRTLAPGTWSWSDYRRFEAPVGRGRALCAGSLLGRLDGARADRRRRA